jgi:hypothetical protein
MAHRIVFQEFGGFDLLSALQINDLIEMFYRGSDTNFIICSENIAGNTLANASYDGFSHTHTIKLCKKNIKKFFSSLGQSGGDLRAPDITTATASVLVHELQHCNQNLVHKDNGVFWGNLGGTNSRGQPRKKRYRGRACEREARAYADEKLNEICAYFGLPFVARRSENRTEDHEELDAVIDLLIEIDSPTLDDIKDELRASGLLRPNNVMIVKKELAEHGVLLDCVVVR